MSRTLLYICLSINTSHSFLKMRIYNMYSQFGASLMACVCAQLPQSCPTLCDPVDCSLPASSGHRILQARILEWVTISFFREVFLTQGLKLHLLCLIHCRQILSLLTEPLGKPSFALVIGIFFFWKWQFFSFKEIFFFNGF